MNFTTTAFFALLAVTSATRIDHTRRSNCTGRQVAKKSFLGKHHPATALLQVGQPECNWQCYLNRYADLQKAFGKTNVKAGQKHYLENGKREKRDCTCGKLDYHLAPAGAVKCDFGQSVPQAKCEEVGYSLVIGGKVPGRGLQLGSGGACNDGGWGNVPPGCSIQSGGDSAPHYKTDDIGCASANVDYQLVCTGGSPPAPTVTAPPLPAPTAPAGMVVDECGATLEVVLTVNQVATEASDVEKKAEKAETDAKLLMETVAEVKAAKAEEVGTAAAQLALSKKVEALDGEVKKEAEEIVEKKEIIKEDAKEAAKIVEPEAKAAVVESEEELKQEVEEEKVEAENKEDEKEAVEKEATAKVMEAVEAKADTAAKEEKFKSEEESMEIAKPLIDAERTFKIKMKAMEVQKTIAMQDAAKATAVAAPAGAPPPPVKKTVADEIKQAEVHKVKIAIKVVETAEKEAKVAVVEQAKAEKVMKEVAAESAGQDEQIEAGLDTIKKLKSSMKKKCRPCGKKVKMLKRKLTIEKMKKR